MTNAYATGKKIYRGGSSAAHSGGGLDPAGYIQRELDKQNQSKMRSGYAASALARIQRNMGYAPQDGAGGANNKPGMMTGMRRTITHPTKKKQVGVGSAKKVGPAKAAQNKQNKNKNKNKSSTPASSGAQTAPAGPSQGTLADDTLNIQTPVMSSATGQLALDPTIQQDWNQSQYEYNTNNINLDSQQATNEAEYAQGKRDLGYQQEDDQRRDLSSATGRGLAFSTGYGQEVANSARDFGNAFGNLDTQYTTNKNAITGNRTANTVFYDAALAAFNQRQAAANTQNAGNLGLDPNYVDPAREAAPAPQSQLPYSGSAAAPNPYAPPAGAKQAPANKKAVGIGQPVVVDAKAAFLKNHPELAATKPGSAARKKFLAAHPKIAEAWARF